MKISKILTTLVAILLFLLLSVPLILKHEGIQKQAADNLAQFIGEQGRLGSVQWRWFPFPSLVLKDFAHENDILTLNVPELIYYPNWLALFKKDVSLGKVLLVEPEIHLSLRPNSSRSLSLIDSKALILPKINLKIDKGTLLLPPGTFATNVKHPRLIFTNIKANFNFDNTQLKFTLNGSSNFMTNYHSVGKIDFSKQHSRFDLQAKGLNLIEILISQQQICKPSPTNFDLTLNFEGFGAKNWQMNIIAPEAGISSILADHSVQIDGIDAISITRLNSDFYTTIKNLNFSKLAKTINGNITSVINDNAQREWSIDLAADSIDIAATRAVVPAIFTSNQYVTEVFDIIRGGKAKDVRFILKGTDTDLKHFEKYKIWATAQQLPIFIRDINLYLDETNGPISIIDGVLSGKGLTAEIGRQNHGTNGKLQLGLTQTNHAFMLDLDLDVDLIDLQNVLSGIITHENFQSELEKLDIISGRATGNLLIEDNLYNLNTTVKIKNFYGMGSYDRIPWQFDILRGELNVLHDKVTWNNLDVYYGPHQITKSKGQVSWQDNDELYFEFSSPSLAVDLGPLFNDFHILTDEDIILLKNYASVISDISGLATLTDLSISGNILDSNSWQYSTEIETGFTLSSAHMPPDTLVTEAHASVTNNKVTYTGNFQFFDQKIIMSGEYWHNRLQNWQGYTELNGNIGANFGNWLKERNTIDEYFFPKLPFAVKKYRLNTSSRNELIQMHGTIIAAQNSAAPVTLKVDINQHKDEEQYRLTIKDGNNQATLSANISKRIPQKSLFTWQGTLNATSVNTIFDHNFMSSGEASGVFSYLHSDESSLRNKFAGYLEAHDLQLSADQSLNELTIKNLLVNGEDNTIKIRTLDLGLSEDNFHITGNVTIQEEQYNLKLSLSADDIHWTLIRNFLDAAMYSDNKKEENEQHETITDSLTGSIDFKIENFHYPKKLPIVEDGGELDLSINDISDPYHVEAETESTAQFVLTPLQGTASFSNSSPGTKVEIDSSNLCGMNVSGTWYSKEVGKLSRYTIVKEDANTPLLQETLPCLYTEHSLIEGPYTFKAKLIGEPGKWRDGFVVFESQKGIIRRMNLLSSIFSVINFTDLFTYDNAENGDNKGLLYNDMVFKSHVKNNTLKVDQAVLKGKGVNISGRGDINLETYDTDLTFFVAPFKMIDSFVTSIPLIGKAIGGKKQSILTIPVAVEGPLHNPKITAMDPASIGSASLDFILETLTLPFRIFIPEKEIEYELDHKESDTTTAENEQDVTPAPDSKSKIMDEEEPLLDGPN